MIRATAKQHLDLCEQFSILPAHALPYGYAAHLLDVRHVTKGIRGVDEMVRIAYELLDAAEKTASEGRSASTLSEVISAANRSLPFYNTAKVLFQWIIARFRDTSQPIPEELQTEHQAVEEVRVAMLETLRDCGGNFVSWAVLHTFWNASAAISVKQAIIRGISDSGARCPAFPDILLRSLTAFSTGAMQKLSTSDATVSRYDWSLSEQVTEAMWAVFESCFEDATVAEFARNLVQTRSG